MWATISNVYYKIIRIDYQSLAVPVTLEAQLIFVVRTYGTVDGTNLDDVRTSSVTVPLDKPLFTPENKFEKDTTKHVTT